MQGTRAQRIGWLAVLSALLAPAAAAQTLFPRERAATSAPASAPALPERAGAQVLAPGLALDRMRGEVLVDGWICLTVGPLEYVACQAGKEHESVVRMRPSAAEVRRALVELGAAPGAPPVWNAEREAFDPPSGDLLDVYVEYLRDGRLQRVNVWEWLIELEYQRVPFERPWLFAGSREAAGELAADRSGGVIALVDDPNSLLALLGRRSERAEELWVGVNTARVPVVGSAVRLVLSRARVRPVKWELDARGDLRADDRWCSLRDAAERLEIERRAGRREIEIVVRRGGLRADERRLRQWLEQVGLAEFVRVVGNAALP